MSQVSVFLANIYDAIVGNGLIIKSSNSNAVYAVCGDFFILVSSELRGQHLIYLSNVLSRQQTNLSVIVKDAKDIKYLRNS